MPSILNLKFKGNKSFVAFSNLNDVESLTQTWKVCTKVASYLEQGQRLENLSWRLWHLQNLIVDTDDARSRREFKKLSKFMGDKLDKEKGRSIEELSAPHFKKNQSTDMIRQRAAEKERSREANQHAGGTIRRMQFTFSVDRLPQPVLSLPVNKPSTKPSLELSRFSAALVHSEDAVMTDTEVPSVKSTNPDSYPTISAPVPLVPSQALEFPSLFNNSFTPSILLRVSPTLTTSMTYGEGLMTSSSDNERFRISRPTIEVPLDEILFNDDCNDDVHWASAINALSGALEATPAPSDEDLMSPIENVQEVEVSAVAETSVSAAGQQQQQQQQQDVMMLSIEPPESISEHSIIQQPIPITPPLLVDTYPDVSETQRSGSISSSSSSGADDEETSSFSDEDEYVNQCSPAPSTARRTSIFKNLAPVSNSGNAETVAPSRLHSIYGQRSGSPNTSRPNLTLKTQGTMTTRSSGPGASLNSLNPAILRGTNNHIGPGGVKAECSNCGATHTPLWRRGLNDELNCNACGLYCKLHKRPRPKTMRNTQGENRAPVTPRQETIEVVGTTRARSVSTKGLPNYIENPPPRQSVGAQCYNCHTTATPLWRKDDEGKTVCNACGLYYKLHGSARPISMKSDVIRKRSRHDARRSSQSGFDDCPTSPIGASSPILAPDSTTQLSYDFEDTPDFRSTTSTSSELIGALGNPTTNSNSRTNTSVDGLSGVSPNDSNTGFGTFPSISNNGVYHPDYLMQMYGLQSDPLPFSSVESIPDTMADSIMSPRSKKRRRLSSDSASSPPASAVSFGGSSTTSTRDGYASARSPSHSRNGSAEFPFQSYNANSPIAQGPALRGSGNTFWHPPMMPTTVSDHETFWQPSLVPSGIKKTKHSNHSKSMHRSIDYASSASDDSSERSVSIMRGFNTNHNNVISKKEDSTMDFLQALQEDELFSAYLHPHEEKVIGSNVDVGNAMYVDSFFQ